MVKKNFEIGGMHCKSCAALVKMTLSDLDGIKSAEADFAKRRASVEFDESRVSEARIIREIKGLGYTAKPAK